MPVLPIYMEDDDFGRIRKTVTNSNSNKTESSWQCDDYDRMFKSVMGDEQQNELKMTL